MENEEKKQVAAIFQRVTDEGVVETSCEVSGYDDDSVAAASIGVWALAHGLEEAGSGKAAEIIEVASMMIPDGELTNATSNIAAGRLSDGRMWSVCGGMEGWSMHDLLSAVLAVLATMGNSSKFSAADLMHELESALKKARLEAF